MPDELYTRLFVDANGTTERLLETVVSLIGGRVKRQTVQAEPVEADVRPNVDANPVKLRNNPRDFIAFPFTIEVVGNGTELEDYLGIVARLMTGLHSGGSSVVAACDWENQLPGNGALYSERGRDSRRTLGHRNSWWYEPPFRVPEPGRGTGGSRPADCDQSPDEQR
jgi:hypothetical protein